MESAVTGRPPVLTSNSVAQVLKEHFEFSEVSESTVKGLPSYFDRNYYFQGKLRSGDPSEYILKLMNPVPTSYESIKRILNVIKHLHSQGFPCPQLISTGELLELSREDLTNVKDDNGMKFPVFVLTYIPGEVLNRIEKRFLSPSLFNEIGVFLGRMDKELKVTFDPTSLTSQVSVEWDLILFPKVKKLLSSVQDTSNRSNAEKVIRGFEQFVSPKLSSLRRGVIHADLTGDNVIVSCNSDNSEVYHVKGFIDFNDSIYTCIIFELAISLAHIMRENLNASTANDDEAIFTTLKLVAPLISGYNSVMPLTDDELDALYYIVLARLVFIAINSERVHAADPENAAHILPYVAKSWNFVNHMLRAGKNNVEKVWKSFL